MTGNFPRLGWLRKLFGDAGERAAVSYLKKKGYRIHGRQMRNLFGEIDIIAQDGECLVFVEVKTRSSDRAGAPSAAVGLRKQRQISRTATAWLKKRNLLDHRARFDVISIIWPSGGQPEIEHIQNAFEAP